MRSCKNLLIVYKMNEHLDLLLSLNSDGFLQIATYCHPLEHVVANLLPPIVGIMITNAHVATSWLWFTIVISITLNDHSGYHLPFLPSPELHDFHHLKFNQCYGSLGILDYLHGTDTLFRSSPEFKRHLVSRTLEPVRKLFPDSFKQKGE